MSGHDDDGGEYLSLAMPFLSVASQGGPHDDDSYTAGWECGALDAELKALARVSRIDGGARTTRPVLTSNVPQLDLIAMRHGFLLSTEPWVDGPEWTFATFTRPSSNVDREEPDAMSDPDDPEPTPDALRSAYTQGYVSGYVDADNGYEPGITSEEWDASCRALGYDIDHNPME